MRFGEQLQMHVTPEWRKQYINYGKLKQILYDGVGGDGLSCEEAPEGLRTAAEEEFFILINKELKKVNQFHMAREADAMVKFEELSSDLNVTIAARHQPPAGAASAPDTLGGRVRQRTRALSTPNDLVKARDRSIASLRDAFSEYYLGLILLQNFERVNTEGFRKICKKHDKLMLNTAGMDFYNQTVLERAYHKSQAVTDLILQTENAVIERLEGGNRQKAMNKLRVPPLDAQVEGSILFRLGLWLGMLFVCLLALILGAIYIDISKGDRATEVLRLYRFGFIILLMAFFIGVNFHFFRRAGVNHVLIFEVNPRDHLPGLKIMEVSCMLAVIWMVCVLLYLYLDLTSATVTSRLGIPIAAASVLTLYLLNPFHLLQYTSRRWLVRRLVRVFTAPYFNVEFADFWLADQLNSIVVSLADFEFLVCFYIFDWARDPFIDHNNTCGVVTYGVRPIVVALPAWFRFAQCLRRYYSTKDGDPHLINAGKYSTTFFVVLFSSLVSWEKGINGGVQQYSYLFVLWVLSAAISTTYTSYWDIWRDWGLMDPNAPRSHRFLRAELVYANKYYYYCAMVGDVAMRLLWTLTVSIGEGGLVHSEILKTVLSVIEVFRRFIWNFFRLENEHLNNVGQFRAVRDISIVPLPMAHLATGARHTDSSQLPAVTEEIDGEVPVNDDDDDDDDQFEMEQCGDNVSAARRSVSQSLASVPARRAAPQSDSRHEDVHRSDSSGSAIQMQDRHHLLGKTPRRSIEFQSSV